MIIPKSYYVTNTQHRGTGSTSLADNSISCGFMYKSDNSYTQRNLIFHHYGAFLLLDGCGEYTDETGVSCVLSPGSFVQRLPGRSHTTVVKGDGHWLEFFICFGAGTYGTLADLEILPREPVLSVELCPLLFEKCTHLLDQFHRQPDQHTPYLYTMLQDFAIHMALSHKTKQQQILDPRMRTAASLLSLIGQKSCTAQDTADHLNMTYESFRKRFKEYYGTPPASFQLEQRIQASKRLLLDTEKTITEIAFLCNFSDGFAYSKAFKKRCGISPAHFRKDLLGH